MTDQAPPAKETAEKVPCKSYFCAAMILPSTSKKTGGYCMPCKRNLKTKQTGIFVVAVLIPVIYIASSPALTKLILDPILNPLNEFLIDPLIDYVVSPLMFLGIGYCWIYMAYSLVQPDMKSTLESLKKRGGLYGIVAGLGTLAFCLIILNLILLFIAPNMIAVVYNYAEPWLCYTGFDNLTSSSNFRQFDLPGYVGWFTAAFSCSGDIGQYPVNQLWLILSTLTIYCALGILLIKLMKIFDRVFSFEINSRSRKAVSIVLSAIIIGMPYAYNDVFTPLTRSIQKIHSSLTPDSTFNLIMLEQIRLGKVEIVKRLLQGGASASAYLANKPDQTAVRMAARQANPEIIRALLDRREDINTAVDVREAFISTIKGIRSDYVETAKAFLDAGFDPAIVFTQGVSVDDLTPAMRRLITQTRPL